MGSATRLAAHTAAQKAIDRQLVDGAMAHRGVRGDPGRLALVIFLEPTPQVRGAELMPGLGRTRLSPPLRVSLQ